MHNFLFHVTPLNLQSHSNPQALCDDNKVGMLVLSRLAAQAQAGRYCSGECKYMQIASWPKGWNEAMSSVLWADQRHASLS